ncbi:hypothetical protein C1H46_013685 [Malus baccata]|uniref:non-specific serine/threonine protein kinase n=1 Tax=Malus baccata TaxID=106549 RepID=A0A540MPL8_MALBA|nr:hypothetical protein C1H46_013685 [Malus baccata]
MDVIFLSHVIVLALLTSNMGTVSSKGQAQSMTLPDDEVEALREIAAQLNKKDWNFSDPCSNIPTFSTPHTDQYNNTLFCNCSISVDVCHVESIFLTAQELDGVLPPSLAKLPYLKKVNLGQNYLSGPIPHEWTSTKLEFLVLSVNNLSGPIPAYLGNMITLQAFYLRANNLTGELPVALTNLTKLKVLWIGSNNFTGRIPDYFLSWKELQMLEMQGSGLEGPIPSSLSALKHMTYLDLSFNRLTGNIPNLVNLLGLATIYLTSNLLTGLPDWIKNRDSRYIVDLSYNNFSENSIPTTCRETFNVFKGFYRQNNSILSNCLSPCSKEYYSVHINCGGKQVTVGNIKYDGDEASGGGAKFVHDTEIWGFSSTGDFGLINYDQDYIAKNISVLKMNNSELYRTARISPLSLTYYARCLANGNYTVKLHFAEIVMRDNRSYYSVGRRIFDVYIQEKLVLKDFDIEKEAQGVDKEVIKVFNAVVNVATLEIRFYWAGKGTSNAPERGIYGSLISAISVESDFKPPADSKTKIYIVVVVVSALCLFFVTAAILWLRCCQELRTSTREQGNVNTVQKRKQEGELSDGTIIAVKQLSSKSKQGNREFVNEVGMISALRHPNLVRLYGCCIERNELLLVYEYMENNSLAHSLFGKLDNLEVKIDTYVITRFMNVIKLLSSLNSGPEESLKKLDWNTRQKICVGIAKGLAFMHEESTLKIVHRDIKTTNILLDKDLNPKISDFGLAKLDEEEKTHISTRVAGTIGYMAPEYALWGHLTDKVDVYSFGVVALELISGKNNIKFRPHENYVCLLDWAFVLQQTGNLMELVDPKLGSDFNKEQAMRMIKVAILCANPAPALRPTMSAVVSMLEGRAIVHELNINPSIYGDEMRLESFRDESNSRSACETESLIYLSDPTAIPSSHSSVQDLYPVNFDF